METYCKYLFVYGSLTDNDNECAIYLKNNSAVYLVGYFNGKLYDLGEYPGAIYDPESKGKVYGKILHLNYDPQVLTIIDEYEGFGEKEAQPNLFIRKMIPVITKSGKIDCWVYLYNQPVLSYPQILSGRYQKKMPS